MYTKKLNTNKGHNYNTKTTFTKRNNISPPAKKKGGEKLREAALEEQKKKPVLDTNSTGQNVQPTEPLSDSQKIEKHHEAIAFLLHHHEDIVEAIKDHTKELNKLNEQLHNHINEL